MVMVMRQGKRNQHGKVEYMGCMRNIDPVLCPLSALAFYFFFCWGRDGAGGEFPSFRQPEDYYDRFALPGSFKKPERQLSYYTQCEWIRRMMVAVGIYSREITHSRRKKGAQHAEVLGVPENEIRRAGRWNKDVMTSVYLSHLPRRFMRSIAGWPQEGKGYFLPRAQETPEEALCSRIWPGVDVWMARMEAYDPGRHDNEVVRHDLAGTGFLRLLRVLRVILLQDSVVLRKQFPLHPLWKDSLFNCPEYVKFAARMEDALANVVTPAELTMQQILPAQEAVAKLRHTGVISSLQEVKSEVKELRECLRQMERSSAASTQPLSVQQVGTGVWIGPAVSAHPPKPPPPPLLPPPPPPQAPNLTAGITSTPATPSAAAAATAATPTSAPTSIPASTPASGPASTLAPQGPIILDPKAPPAPYKMHRGSNSVFQLWVEWTMGLAGGPSIEALNRCWGARWRASSSEGMFYSRRRRVIAEIRRRADAGTARSEREAVDQLEQLRGSHSLDWLCKNVNK